MKRFEKLKDPFIMAAGFLVVFLLIFAIHFLIVRISGEKMDMLNIWIYTMGAALVFSIFSTINLLYAADTSRYYFRTILAFASLLLTGGLISTWIGSQSIFELDSYRKVVLFIIIAFLTFISIASMIKRLDEWSKNYDKKFLNKDKDEFE